MTKSEQQHDRTSDCLTVGLQGFAPSKSRNTGSDCLAVGLQGSAPSGNRNTASIRKVVSRNARSISNGTIDGQEPIKTILVIARSRCRLPGW